MKTKEIFPEFTKEKIDSIEQWKDVVIFFCKKYLIEHGRFEAMAFWFNLDEKKNGVIACNSFMESGQSKDALVSFLKMMVSAAKPNALIFASESWFLKQKHIKGKKLPSNISNHPDRSEALVFNFETINTGKFILYDVRHPSVRERLNGKKRTLELMEFPGNPGFTGRFTSLLHKPIKTEDN